MIKKIQTKADRERRNKKNQIIIGLILIVLMVLSTLAWAFTMNDDSNIVEKRKINGIEFTYRGDRYSFFLNNQEYYVKHTPKEVENLSITGFMNVNQFSQLPLYIEGDRGEAYSEISFNMRNHAFRIQPGCSSDVNCTSDSPVKNCSSDNIIVFREPEENEHERIYKSDYCVYIISKEENRILYSDRLIYKLLSIQ